MQGIRLAIAVVAVIGGVVVRFFAPSPLWLDEALSVHIAGLGFGDMVEALRHDGHPSLYYLLLGWWMDLFGESNGAARSLSAVLSLATVPVLWAIGRRWSAHLGFTAAVVGLTSPYLLRYGGEARMYALIVFLSALAWLAVERAIRTPSAGRLCAVAAVVAALVHTHYWSFWAIGAAVVVLAGSAWLGSAEDRRAAIRVTGAVLTGAATFVAWLPVFLDQLASTGTPWADRARPAEVAVEVMQAIGGNSRFEGELLGVILVGLAVVGAIGSAQPQGVSLVLTRGPLTPAAAMTLATLALGGGVALVTAGAFEGRYAAIVIPFVALLIARGLAVLPPRAGLGALTVVAVFGLAVGIDEARRDRSQAGDVAAVIDRDHSPGDVVAFCPDQVGPATRRALTAELEAVAFPRGDGSLVDWSDYADTIEASPADTFVQRALDRAGTNDIWMVTGLGYKSLGSRCEAIIDLLNAARRPSHLIAPSEAYEPMLLTRYEPVE